MPQASRAQWENIWEVVRRIDLRVDGDLVNPEEGDDQEGAGSAGQLVSVSSPRGGDQLVGAASPRGGTSPELLAMIPYDPTPVDHLAITKPVVFFSFADLPEPTIEDTPCGSPLKKVKGNAGDQKTISEEAPPDVAQGSADEAANTHDAPNRASTPAAKRADVLSLSPAEQSALAAASQKASVLATAAGHNAMKTQADAALKKLQEERKETAKAEGAQQANHTIPTHTHIFHRAIYHMHSLAYHCDPQVVKHPSAKAAAALFLFAMEAIKPKKRAAAADAAAPAAPAAAKAPRKARAKATKTAAPAAASSAAPPAAEEAIPAAAIPRRKDPEVLAEAKRVHSRAYHTTFRTQRANGLDDKAAKDNVCEHRLSTLPTLPSTSFAPARGEGTDATGAGADRRQEGQEEIP